MDVIPDKRSVLKGKGRAPRPKVYSWPREPSSSMDGDITESEVESAEQTLENARWEVPNDATCDKRSYGTAE